MNRRQTFQLFGSAVLTYQISKPISSKAQSTLTPQPQKKGVMLMNRIAPSVSELYIADLDGTNERKLLRDSAFDYNARMSANGDWIVFTSERRADGQSDVYRVKSDGSVIEPLIIHDAMDDAGVLSPDGRSLAFVSTRNG